MTITRLHTGPTFFDVEVAGKTYSAKNYREVLARQGVVLTHPDIGQPVVILHDPDDEESALDQVDHAIRSRELAQLQIDWFEGRLPDGWHEISLTV